MTPRPVPAKFFVAFSLAGEQRALVAPVAAAVEQILGWGTVFYDEWFEHYIAGDDADLRILEIFGSRAHLVIPCVSARYGGKPWTRTEHKAIRALQMRLYESENPAETLRIMPLRFGDGDVEGILFNTIVPDVRTRSADTVVDLIVARLETILPGVAAKTLTISLRADPSSRPTAAGEPTRVRVSVRTGSNPLHQNTGHLMHMPRLVGALKEFLTDDATPNREARAHVDALIRVVGEDLGYDLALRLKNEIDTSVQRVHVQIDAADDLKPFPWETLWAGSDGLASGCVFSRFTGLPPRPAFRRPGPLRALVVGVPRASASFDASDAVAVTGTLHDLVGHTESLLDFDRRRDALLGDDIRIADVRGALRTGAYDIVHISSPIIMPSDDQPPGLRGWSLSDGALWTMEVANTLAWSPTKPWLVFVNGSSERDHRLQVYNEAAFALADDLIESGSTHCIAALWRADAVSTRKIASAFYEELLGRRQPIGESLRRAAATAREEYWTPRGTPDRVSGAAMLSWARLLLFGDSWQSTAHRTDLPAPE